MKQTIKFTFEGFEIEAKFSKDSEPPFDSWELDDWKLVNNQLFDFSLQMLILNSWDFGEVKERVEAACYEALEDYDEENDKFDER
jgi:hypothetical protein